MHPKQRQALSATLRDSACNARQDASILCSSKTLLLPKLTVSLTAEQEAGRAGRRLSSRERRSCQEAWQQRRQRSKVSLCLAPSSIEAFDVWLAAEEEAGREGRRLVARERHSSQGAQQHVATSHGSPQDLMLHQSLTGLLCCRARSRRGGVQAHREGEAQQPRGLAAEAAGAAGGEASEQPWHPASCQALRLAACRQAVEPLQAGAGCALAPAL